MDVTTMPGSQIRHRPIHKTVQVAPIKPRRSRPSQVLRSRTSQGFSTQDQALIDGLTYQRYTDDDEQLAPAIRGHIAEDNYTHYYRDPRRNRTLVAVGVGMCATLLLLVVGLNVYVWMMNNVSDPSYYSQTAHRNIVVVNGAQGQEQIQSFVDADGYLDELIIPTNQSISKSRLVRGPLLTGFPNPQNALLSTKVVDGQILTEATGSRDITIYGGVTQPDARWTTDANGNAITAEQGGK